MCHRGGDTKYKESIFFGISSQDLIICRLLCSVGNYRLLSVAHDWNIGIMGATVRWTNKGKSVSYFISLVWRKGIILKASYYSSLHIFIYILNSGGAAST